MIRQWLPALLAAVILAGAPLGAQARDKDLLESARDRMKVEAQRVEKMFAVERAAAYKLVRSETPKLVDATDKLETLLTMLEKDDSLDAKRRQVLIVTVKWDLGRVKEIAGERRGSSINSTLPRETRSTVRRDEDDRGSSGSRSMVRDARSIMQSRSRDVSDSRDYRSRSADRFNRVGRSVEKTASAPIGDYVLPKDWPEKSKRRSSGIKMTAKEKAIMAALKKMTGVDYNSATFEEVIADLKKSMGCEIIVDKRGMDEANVKYDSQINLKMRSTARTVLKRVLADLGLAYVVKDEAILITSLERAKQMTTTRTYYIGDLADVVDISIPPGIRALLMQQNVNQIISLVTSIERQSWQVNNPEAPGTIVFYPPTMTLSVKQTAEMHFMLAGK